MKVIFVFALIIVVVAAQDNFSCDEALEVAGAVNTKCFYMLVCI
jgi:hypothetical protein